MEIDLVQIVTSIVTSSVVATGLAFFLNYGLTRRTLMAKVNDRLFDLDKLILANAEAFTSFLALGDKEDDTYFASKFEAGPPDKQAVQHRAIAFYYLNVFEEMYLAHHIFRWLGPSLSPDWKARESYIFERLKHPLIRETLMASAGIKTDRAGLISGDTGHYNKAFIAHLCENERAWSGTRNRNVW